MNQRHRPIQLSRFLGYPLTRRQRVLTWTLIGVLAYGLVRVLGGIDSGDSFEVIVPSWAIAHGSLACAFPSGGVDGNPFGAPLYAFLTAGPVALLHLGSAVAFPSGTALGPHCATAAAAIVHWATFANAITPTLQFSYVAPLALAIGAVFLIRARGPGRSVWEPITVALLLLAPPVISAFIDYFHPQDLIALGLILAALGAGLRARWGLAGVLLAVAFASQQFALLAIAPLVVILPARERRRLVFAVGAVLIPVSVALYRVSSLSALRVLLFGSDRITLGANLFTSRGGTVLWELHLHGSLLFVLTRAAPVVVAMVLARAVARRPELASDPLTLVSLVGVGLTLRLVFEVNLFGYYFAAAAVMLVVLDVLQGRLRATTLVWLSLSGIAFYPAPQSASAVHVVFITAVAAVVVARILQGALGHRVRWGAITYGVALITVNVVFASPFVHHALAVPGWAWQAVLVPWVLWLLGEPLAAAFRPADAVTG